MCQSVHPHIYTMSSKYLLRHAKIRSLLNLSKAQPAFFKIAYIKELNELLV